MLRIRLQRIGRKKQPTYRFIVSDRIRDTQYGSIEILGNYNPAAMPKVLNVKEDRINYWISVGAQPSDTVNNILITAGIIKGKKANPISITQKRGKKLTEKKAKEAAEKATKAAPTEQSAA